MRFKLWQIPTGEHPSPLDSKSLRLCLCLPPPPSPHHSGLRPTFLSRVQSQSPRHQTRRTRLPLRPVSRRSRTRLPSHLQARSNGRSCSARHRQRPNRRRCPSTYHQQCYHQSRPHQAFRSPSDVPRAVRAAERLRYRTATKRTPANIQDTVDPVPVLRAIRHGTPRARLDRHWRWHRTGSLPGRRKCLAGGPLLSYNPIRTTFRRLSLLDPGWQASRISLRWFPGLVGLSQRRNR